MLLRSRVVLPVTSPALEDGAVLIRDGRISRVGRWRELRAGAAGAILDLGEAILLPGLINGHCHLDYTGMAGQIAPARSFTDWIQILSALKAHWGIAEYIASWLEGADMLRRRGVTTVVDIEAVPELLATVWRQCPLRIVSLLEMTGVKSRRSPRQILLETARRLEALPAGRHRAGLSPHALYSTTPDLVRLSAGLAAQRQWPLSIHLAESIDEHQMYAEQRGPLYDWLKNQRDMTDCAGRSPVEQLDCLGVLGPRLLAVHANYLSDADARRLGERGVTVVHCPRSHAYFGHDPFPLERLERAGVNICLGTDSLVSVVRETPFPVLDLLAELRAFIQANGSVSPETAVRMVTINAARALGCQGRLGELAPEAWADLAVIPYAGDPGRAADAVVAHAGPVSAVMVEGQWVLAPGSPDAHSQA